MRAELFQAARVALALTFLAGAARAYDWENYRVEDFEEPAGAHSLFESNPADGLYGVGLGDGTWLRGAPVLGDYFLSFFWNGKEDAVYAGVGMTLRLMPRASFAPFAGGGGSYNQVLASDAPADEVEQGRSYWGAHAEGGIRFRARGRWYEMLGRYVWSSSGIEAPDYWLIRLGCGVPLGGSQNAGDPP
jgi:hypothetical protein